MIHLEVFPDVTLDADDRDEDEDEDEDVDENRSESAKTTTMSRAMPAHWQKWSNIDPMMC